MISNINKQRNEIDLIERADAAMYLAKTNGRSQCKIYKADEE